MNFFSYSNIIILKAIKENTQTYLHQNFFLENGTAILFSIRSSGNFEKTQRNSS